MNATQTYVAALHAKGERWIVLYTDKTRDEALRTLGRWASTPWLAFDWSNAMVLAKKIREGVAA